jgi:hypothetical protein
MAFSRARSVSARKKLGMGVVAASAALVITVAGMSQASAAGYSVSDVRACANKSYVTKGHAGKCVRVLQDSLNKVDKAGLKVDGKFGSGTLRALKKFQRDEPGLDTDGYAGKATFTRLADCQVMRVCKK